MRHTIRCNFLFVSGTTVISDFNLVCDRKQFNNMAEMVFLAGVALGGLVSGIISDKYGRKKTLMTSIFLQALLGKGLHVSKNFFGMRLWKQSFQSFDSIANFWRYWFKCFLLSKRLNFSTSLHTVTLKTLCIYSFFLY